ncbi:MAG: hypothetical protein KJ556_22035 [Gammaproteobacteria bacterium]|nr:hypothetical protein [Gammaproteobacteria bacterium]
MANPVRIEGVNHGNITNETLSALNVVIISGGNKVGHDVTTIGQGVKVVATVGTDLQIISTSTAAKIVIIESQTDNTGLIAVGGSGVDATEATGTGVILYAGDTITVPVDDLSDVYIDATVSGEGVRYTYFG